MPPLETTSLIHKAVLWKSTSRLTRDGRKKVEAPIQIKCRWEKVRRQSINGAGAIVGTVATVVVDREAPDGSILWLGELDDWYGTGSGHDEGELMEVVSYEEVSDIKGRNVRREVGLVRGNDTLPPLV